jgi:ABC-2 type transport system permease protein
MTTTLSDTRTRTESHVARAPRAERSARSVWWRAYVHHLRVMRTQAIAWILVLVGVGTGVAAGFAAAYETQAERDAAAASIEGVPAFEALFGRTVELATVEGFVLWRWGGFAVLVVAVWGMLSAVRLARGAEEAGHVEPLRAGVITPRGLLGSILAALFTLYLVLAVAVGLTHTAGGMDAATAWAMGAGFALLAASTAAGAALAAQVFGSRRRTLGVVGAVVGVLLLVRVLAAGTGTPDWLWGVTPFGWMSYLHAVDGARLPVFTAFTVLVAALTAGALALARRDLHGALISASESRVHRGRPIGSHTGLVVRNLFSPLAVWGTGLAAGGLIFGLLAQDFAEAFADLEGTREMAEQIGWVGLDTPEGSLASLLLFLGLVLALFAAAQAAAIREEEASWRIEPMLVRPVGRAQWLLTRAAAAAAGIVVLAFVTALAGWAGTALSGNALAAGDVLPAAINLVPLAWLFLGIGVALAGVAPRWTAPVTFGLVVGTYLLDLVGGLLELPEGILELSPFRHLTAVPVVDMAVGAILIMLVAAAAGAALGAAAFRRRDLQEA